MAIQFRKATMNDACMDPLIYRYYGLSRSGVRTYGLMEFDGR